ncbi:Protein lethal(2)essential for life like protein [Argiope bruennichi]|uniref:Protein lethal(2)essential for life like protein n=1 Tax=Argiope bruennichi TaxID=94029 RepID=A0A8T0FEI1_ARGBR|nr:Protein lethal(2)essential for life like protein [Argiope bruennichi]
MAFSSLYPSRGWWDPRDYPALLNDPHFGMGLFDSDLLPTVLHRGFHLRPRTRANIDSSGLSEIKKDTDKFKVRLNVKHFKPNEISVKTVDNFIVIHCKHEEKSDEHGFISREFTRRYILPEGAAPEAVVSKLTPDGILTVEAPRKVTEPSKPNERVVPITLQQPAVEGKSASKSE